jgi:hypothetical protein
MIFSENRHPLFRIMLWWLALKTGVAGLAPNPVFLKGHMSKDAEKSPVLFYLLALVTRCVMRSTWRPFCLSLDRMTVASTTR